MFVYLNVYIKILYKYSFISTIILTRLCRALMYQQLKMCRVSDSIYENIMNTQMNVR